MSQSLQIIFVIWIYVVVYLIFTRLILRRINVNHLLLSKHLVGSGAFANIITSWNLSRFIIFREYRQVDDNTLALLADVALVMLCLLPLVVIGSIYVVLS